MMEIAITNGVTVTLNDDGKVFDPGTVVIADDRITAVGPVSGISVPEQATVIDARGGIVMPGLINCHTETALMGPEGDGRLGYAHARLAIEQMIRSGTTCFCDVTERDGTVSEAAAEVGMTCLSAVSRQKAVHVADVSATMDTDRFHEGIRAAADSGKKSVLKLPVTFEDCAVFHGRFGMRPLSWLERSGALGRHTLLCRLLDITPEELMMLADTGTGAVLCPEATMDLRTGAAPAPAMISAGIHMGMGTGGGGQNRGFDMFREMDFIAKLHKVMAMDPVVMSARDVVGLATRGGAGLLGMGAHMGALIPGMRADVIVVDTSAPRMQPMYNPWSHLVYAASAADVRWAIAGGRILVEAGSVTLPQIRQGRTPSGL